MADTEVMGIRSIKANVTRLLLVTLVALAVVGGSVGLSVNHADARTSEEVTQSVCDDLAAGVFYWLEEGQDALGRGDRYGYVIANTFAQWYFDAFVGAGC